MWPRVVTTGTLTFSLQVATDPAMYRVRPWKKSQITTTSGTFPEELKARLKGEVEICQYGWSLGVSACSFCLSGFTLKYLFALSLTWEPGLANVASPLPRLQRFYPVARSVAGSELHVLTTTLKVSR